MVQSVFIGYTEFRVLHLKNEDAMPGDILPESPDVSDLRLLVFMTFSSLAAYIQTHGLYGSKVETARVSATNAVTDAVQDDWLAAGSGYVRSRGRNAGRSTAVPA